MIQWVNERKVATTRILKSRDNENTEVVHGWDITRLDPNLL